jgi:hypothetical protein
MTDNFVFDGDYKNLDQVLPFYPAYIDRYDLFKAQGQYPYNDLFRKGVVKDPASRKDEDAGIYLLQTLRAQLELADRVVQAKTDGYYELDTIPTDWTKYAGIIHYGFYTNGTGWQQWLSARLCNVAGSVCVLPKGKSVKGYRLTGKVLVRDKVSSSSGRCRRCQRRLPKGLTECQVDCLAS